MVLVVLEKEDGKDCLKQRLQKLDQEARPFFEIRVMNDKEGQIKMEEHGVTCIRRSVFFIKDNVRSSPEETLLLWTEHNVIEDLCMRKQ